jgi:hypothetical protein
MPAQSAIQRLASLMEKRVAILSSKAKTVTPDLKADLASLKSKFALIKEGRGHGIKPDHFIREFEEVEEDLIDALPEKVADHEAAESDKINDDLIEIAEQVDHEEEATASADAASAIMFAVASSGGYAEVIGFQKRSAADRLRARKLRLKYMRTASGRAAMRRARIAAKRRRMMHKRPNAQRSRIAKLAHKAYYY